MKINFLITLLVFFYPVIFIAQVIDVDFNPSFNTPTSINSVIELEDGKLIIGGNFSNVNNSRQNGLAFLNSDGSLDERINLGEGLKGAINEMILASDGNIIIGGNFSSYQGNTFNNLLKIQPNGEVDTTFKTGTGFDNVVYDMVELSDGGFLISGAFDNYQGVPVNKLAKLTSDGRLDITFNQGNVGLENPITTRPLLRVGPNNILFGIGDFSTYNGVIQPIISIDENGEVNNTFQIAELEETIWWIEDMVLRSNGQISALTAASNSQLLTFSQEGFIAEIIDRESNGSPMIRAISTEDEFGSIYFGGGVNFSGGGNGSGHPHNPIYVDLINGYFHPHSSAQVGADNEISFIKVLKDNSVLIAGSFTQIGITNKFGIAKLGSFGNLDNSFEAKILNSGTVQGIALQSDGKILSGGVFFDASGNAVNHIARIQADGSYDESFQQDIIFNKFPIVDISLQQDGKLLICTAVDRVNDHGVHRINPDGRTDLSFNFPTIEIQGGGDLFSSIIALPNGRIAVTGKSIPIAPLPTSERGNGILWLENDGSIDLNFTNAFTAENIQEVFPLSDNSMFITGNAISFMGSPNTDLMKITPQEEMDDKFNLLSFRRENSPGLVQKIDVEENGNILVGGYFNSLNNLPVSNSFVALFPDGAINEESGIGSGFTRNDNQIPQIHALKVLSNRWTVVAGDFHNYQNIPVNSVVVLGADKQLIQSFPFYSYESIEDIEQNEDWIYLAGRFILGPNHLNTSLARFSIQSVSSEEIAIENVNLFNVYPTLVRDRSLTISLNSSIPLLPTSINLYASTGQRIKSYNNVEIADITVNLSQELSKGTYYIQVVSGVLHQTKKIIIP